MRYAESYIRLKNGRYTKSQLEIESGRYNLSVEETSYTVTSLKVGIKYSEATRISSRNLKTIQERRLLYLLLGSARCRLSTTQGTTKQPARVCRPLSALQTHRDPHTHSAGYHTGSTKTARSPCNFTCLCSTCRFTAFCSWTPRTSATARFQLSYPGMSWISGMY